MANSSEDNSVELKYNVIELPSSVEIKESLIRQGEPGAFCKAFIKKDTRFGPYKGEIVKAGQKADIDYRYAWEVFEKRSRVLRHTIDARDSEKSNWMRNVNSARFYEEQNILSVQEGFSIYYVAMKDIKAGEELLTWFDPKLLKKTERRQSQIKKERRQIGYTIELVPWSDEKKFVPEIMETKRARKKKVMSDMISFDADAPLVQRSLNRVLPRRKDSASLPRRKKSSDDFNYLPVKSGTAISNHAGDVSHSFSHFSNKSRPTPTTFSHRDPTSFPLQKTGTHTERIRNDIQQSSRKSMHPKFTSGPSARTRPELSNPSLGNAVGNSQMSKTEGAPSVFIKPFDPTLLRPIVLRRKDNGKTEIEDHDEIYTSDILFRSQCDDLCPCLNKSEMLSSKVEPKKPSDDTTDANKFLCIHFSLVPDNQNIISFNKIIFRCDICDSAYNHAFSLKRHYLKVHINHRYLSKNDIQDCQIETFHSGVETNIPMDDDVTEKTVPVNIPKEKVEIQALKIPTLSDLAEKNSALKTLDKPDSSPKMKLDKGLIEGQVSDTRDESSSCASPIKHQEEVKSDVDKLPETEEKDKSNTDEEKQSKTIDLMTADKNPNTHSIVKPNDQGKDDFRVDIDMKTTRDANNQQDQIDNELYSKMTFTNSSQMSPQKEIRSIENPEESNSISEKASIHQELEHEAHEVSKETNNDKNQQSNSSSKEGDQPKKTFDMETEFLKEASDSSRGNQNSNENERICEISSTSSEAEKPEVKEENIKMATGIPSERATDNAIKSETAAEIENQNGSIHEIQGKSIEPLVGTSPDLPETSEHVQEKTDTIPDKDTNMAGHLSEIIQVNETSACCQLETKIVTNERDKDLEKESKDLEKESKDLEKESKDLKKESKDLEKESKDLENEGKDLEKESKDLKKESKDLEKESNGLENESKDLEKESKGLEKESKDLEKESKDLEKENKDLEKESKDLEKESKDFEKESNGLEKENKDLEKESNGLENESKDLEKESNCLEKENKDLEKESNGLENESKDLEKESKDMEKETKDLEKENKGLDKESKDLEKGTMNYGMQATSLMNTGKQDNEKEFICPESNINEQISRDIENTPVNELNDSVSNDKVTIKKETLSNHQAKANVCDSGVTSSGESVSLISMPTVSSPSAQSVGSIDPKRPSMQQQVILLVPIISPTAVKPPSSKQSSISTSGISLKSPTSMPSGLVATSPGAINLLPSQSNVPLMVLSKLPSSTGVAGVPFAPSVLLQSPKSVQGFTTMTKISGSECSTAKFSGENISAFVVAQSVKGGITKSLPNEVSTVTANLTPLPFIPANSSLLQASSTPNSYMSTSYLSGCQEDKQPSDLYRCHMCVLVFKTMGELKFHIRNDPHRFKGGIKQYACVKCSLRFRNKHNLARHNLMHHRNTNEDEDRKFKCLTCGKGFTSENYLRMHARFHLGKSFPCKYGCQDVAFPNAATLVKHLRAVHPGLNLKEYIREKAMQERMKRYGITYNGSLTDKPSYSMFHPGIGFQAKRGRPKGSKNIKKLSNIPSPHPSTVISDNHMNIHPKQSNVLHQHQGLDTEETKANKKHFMFKCKLCSRTFRFHLKLLQHRSRVHGAFQSVQEFLYKMSKDTVIHDGSDHDDYSYQFSPPPSPKTFFSNVNSRGAENIQNYIDGGIETVKRYQEDELKYYASSEDIKPPVKLDWPFYNFPICFEYRDDPTSFYATVDEQLSISAGQESLQVSKKEDSSDNLPTDDTKNSVNPSNEICTQILNDLVASVTQQIKKSKSVDSVTTAVEVPKDKTDKDDMDISSFSQATSSDMVPELLSNSSQDGKKMSKRMPPKSAEVKSDITEGNDEKDVKMETSVSGDSQTLSSGENEANVHDSGYSSLSSQCSSHNEMEDLSSQLLHKIKSADTDNFTSSSMTLKRIAQGHMFLDVSGKWYAELKSLERKFSWLKAKAINDCTNISFMLKALDIQTGKRGKDLKTQANIKRMSSLRILEVLDLPAGNTNKAIDVTHHTDLISDWKKQSNLASRCERSQDRSFSSVLNISDSSKHDHRRYSIWSRQQTHKTNAKNDDVICCPVVVRVIKEKMMKEKSSWNEEMKEQAIPRENLKKMNSKFAINQKNKEAFANELGLMSRREHQLSYHVKHKESCHCIKPPEIWNVYDKIWFGKKGNITVICSICHRHFSCQNLCLRHQVKKHPHIEPHSLEIERDNYVDDMFYYYPMAYGILAHTQLIPDNLPTPEVYVCTRCTFPFKNLNRLHAHLTICDPSQGQGESSGNRSLSSRKKKKLLPMMDRRMTQNSDPVSSKSGSRKLLKLNPIPGISKSQNYPEFYKKEYISSNPVRSISSRPEWKVEAKPLTSTTISCVDEISSFRGRKRRKNYSLLYNPSNHSRRREMYQVLDQHQCHGCNLKFKSMSLLERHVKKCSGRDKLRSQKPLLSALTDDVALRKQHTCRYCNKRFTYIKGVDLHYKRICSVRKIKEEENQLTAEDLAHEAELQRIIEHMKWSKSLNKDSSDIILGHVRVEEDGTLIRVDKKRGRPFGKRKRMKKKGYRWTTLKRHRADDDNIESSSQNSLASNDSKDRKEENDIATQEANSSSGNKEKMETQARQPTRTEARKRKLSSQDAESPIQVPRKKGRPRKNVSRVAAAERKDYVRPRRGRPRKRMLSPKSEVQDESEKQRQCESKSKPGCLQERESKSRRGCSQEHETKSRPGWSQERETKSRPGCSQERESKSRRGYSHEHESKSRPGCSQERESKSRPGCSQERESKSKTGLLQERESKSKSGCLGKEGAKARENEMLECNNNSGDLESGKPPKRKRGRPKKYDPSDMPSSYRKRKKHELNDAPSAKKMSTVSNSSGANNIGSVSGHEVGTNKKNVSLASKKVSVVETVTSVSDKVSSAEKVNNAFTAKKNNKEICETSNAVNSLSPKVSEIGEKPATECEHLLSASSPRKEKAEIPTMSAKIKKDFCTTDKETKSISILKTAENKLLSSNIQTSPKQCTLIKISMVPTMTCPKEKLPDTKEKEISCDMKEKLSQKLQVKETPGKMKKSEEPAVSVELLKYLTNDVHDKLATEVSRASDAPDVPTVSGLLKSDADLGTGTKATTFNDISVSEKNIGNKPVKIPTKPIKIVSVVAGSPLLKVQTSNNNSTIKLISGAEPKDLQAGQSETKADQVSSKATSSQCQTLSTTTTVSLTSPTTNSAIDVSLASSTKSQVVHTLTPISVKVLSVSPGVSPRVSSPSAIKIIRSPPANTSIPSTTSLSLISSTTHVASVVSYPFITSTSSQVIVNPAKGKTQATANIQTSPRLAVAGKPVTVIHNPGIIQNVSLPSAVPLVTGTNTQIPCVIRGGVPSANLRLPRIVSGNIRLSQALGTQLSSAVIVQPAAIRSNINLQAKTKVTVAPTSIRAPQSRFANSAAVPVRGMTLGPVQSGGTILKVANVRPVPKVVPKGSSAQITSPRPGHPIAVGQQAQMLTIGQQAQTLNVGQQAQTLTIGQQAQTLNVGQQAQTLTIGQQAQTPIISQQAQTIIVGQQAQALNSQNSQSQTYMAHTVDAIASSEQSETKNDI